ncbi:MAG: cold shock domain-containing protein [Candidatus Hermodarchaeota archaeon]
MTELTPNPNKKSIKKFFGIVKWFNNKMGYGFIQTQQGRDVFVHHSAVQIENLGAYKTLKEGDRVKFELVEEKKGPQAINVIKITKTNLIPNQIIQKLSNKELDPSTAIEYLKTIIETSNIKAKRLEALEELSKIPPKNDKIFNILENILLSDKIEDMRIFSVKILINKFLNKAREVLKWVIEHEKSIKILLNIYKTLKQENSDTSKKLIEEMAKEIGSELLHKHGIEPMEAMGLEFLERITGVKAVKGGYMDYDVLSFNIYNNHINTLKIYEIDFSYFKENEIRNIAFLELFPYLESLEISHCYPKEISGLETLTNLERLNLMANKITEIKGLENLTGLKELNLSWNQISEIRGLDTLKSLEQLILNNNQISEIRGLEHLTNLRMLYLDENLISEMKGLDSLKRLEILNLDNNKITEIKGLNLLPSLRIFHLDFTKVRDFWENYEEFRKNHPHIQIS